MSFLSYLDDRASNPVVSFPVSFTSPAASKHKFIAKNDAGYDIVLKLKPDLSKDISQLRLPSNQACQLSWRLTQSGEEVAAGRIKESSYPKACSTYATSRSSIGTFKAKEGVEYTLSITGEGKGDNGKNYGITIFVVPDIYFSEALGIKIVLAWLSLIAAIFILLIGLLVRWLIHRRNRMDKETL